MEANQDKWMLLYEDQLAQIWGNRNRFGGQQIEIKLSGADVPNIDEITAPVRWPAFATELQESVSSDVALTN